MQNLFDLTKNGTEYSEYIPFTSTKWNKKNYAIKCKNIARVIKDIKPDIIALEEIESVRALKQLQKTLRWHGVNFRYYAIASKKRTSVRNALLSKYPITKQLELSVNRLDRLRAILEVHLRIHGHELVVFVNHFKAKSGPESKRLAYAKLLSKRLKQLPPRTPYLIVGDLNSNVNEFQTFKHSQRLNNTNGVTGINHILKTIYHNRLITPKKLKTLKSYYHANLWTQIPPKERITHYYKGKGGSLDHIIISKALVDKRGIDYIDHSFNRFAPTYLIKGKHIQRWKRTYKRPIHFTGKGFSDHLPVFADFRF